tara:strand:- start:2800 stop:4569 length:1770 start_codon:yes stop_codon:yes gene_type:complete
MAKTAFIAVSHNQMDGTYLPREVYAILGPTLFKDIKEGQWSYDVNHGKESNKTHVIKVYEGKKAGTTYWSTNCGRDGKKLKKKIEDLKKKKSDKTVEVSFPSETTKPQIDINFHIPNRAKPFKVRVQDTGTTITTTAATATKTDMREDATMKFIEMAATKPSKYVFQASEWDKVMTVDNGKFYQEIIKIFPLLENGAGATTALEQESCMASGRLMKRVLDRNGGVKGGTWKKWTHYSREDKAGDFMGFCLDEMAKLKVPGLTRGQKDAWNPADIWLCRNLASVKKRIKDALKGVTGKQGLSKLNQELRDMFVSGEVVGVSLKVVTKPKQGALWEVFNVKPSQFDTSEDEVKLDTPLGQRGQMSVVGTKALNYKLGPMECKLKIKGKGKNASMETQEAKIVLNSSTPDSKGGFKSKYSFTVKTTSGVKQFAGLKYEPIETYRSAARTGKSPVFLVEELLDKLGIGPKAYASSPKRGHSLKWQDYPQSKKEWSEVDDIYLDMFKAIKGKVLTNVHEDEFISSFDIQFKNNPHFANTKLMQINFLHSIHLLTLDDRTKLLNHMLMMALKMQMPTGKFNVVGRDWYGPFGKIS